MRSMIKEADQNELVMNPPSIEGQYLPDGTSKELNIEDARLALASNDIVPHPDDTSTLRLNLYPSKMAIRPSSKRILFNSGHSVDLMNQGIFTKEDLRFIQDEDQEGSDVKVFVFLDIDKINKLKNKDRETKMVVFENMIKEVGTLFTSIKGYMLLIKMYKDAGTPIPDKIKNTTLNNLELFINLYPQVVGFYRRNQSWIKRKAKTSGIKALREHESVICNLVGISKASIRRFKPSELKHIRKYVTSSL